MSKDIVYYIKGKLNLIGFTKSQASLSQKYIKKQFNDFKIKLDGTKIILEEHTITDKPNKIVKDFIEKLDLEGKISYIKFKKCEDMTPVGIGKITIKKRDVKEEKESLSNTKNVLGFISTLYIQKDKEIAIADMRQLLFDAVKIVHDNKVKDKTLRKLFKTKEEMTYEVFDSILVKIATSKEYKKLKSYAKEALSKEQYRAFKNYINVEVEHSKFYQKETKHVNIKESIHVKLKK